jgi:hypothetical protein
MVYNIHDRSKIVGSVGKTKNRIDNLTSQNCINNLTNSISGDLVQNLVYMTKIRGGNLDNFILKLIVNETIKSESAVAGTGNLSLRFLSYYLDTFKGLKTKKDRMQSIDCVRNDIIETSRFLNEFLRKMNINDLKKMIHSAGFSKDTSRIIKEIITNMEIGESINIEKSNTLETYFEKANGNSIKIEVPQLSLSKNNCWNRQGVNIILIDGTIESVSQIHHLLEKASSSREPYLIICRKSLEEVRKTIDVNFIRGTLDLFLVETDFNIQHHHIFKDMSTIFDCSYVDIKMGDTISSKIDKLSFKVEEVSIRQNNINFINTKSNFEKISNYIKEIQDVLSKIDSSNDTAIEISKSADERIKFLQSSCINVNIGLKDLKRNPEILLKIDRFLRSFQDIGVTGILDLSSIKNRKIPKLVSLFSSEEKKNIYTQRQIAQSLISAFGMYKILIKADKVFTIAI